MRPSIVVAFVAACSANHAQPPDSPLAKGCPIGLHFVTLAGSHAEVGTAGRLTTGAPLNAEYSVDVIDHDGTDAKCTVAEFSGPSVRTESDAVFQRCLTQPSHLCTADSDCPAFRCLPNPGRGGAKMCQNTGGSCTSDAQCKLGTQPANAGACKIMLGAPLPIPPPVPGCVAVALSSPDGSPGVHGTIDLVHGTVDMDVFEIFAWSDNAGACNLCVGDDRPNDGLKHGTCTTNVASTGPSPGTGAPCDSAGTNAQYPGSYSYDCMTNPEFISLPINIAPMSTDGTRWKLDASRPTSPSGRVWCGVCQDTTGTTTWKTCTTAADCGGGNCVGTTADGIDLAANNCQGGVCSYDPATGGTCTQAGSGAQPTIFCLPSASDAVAISPGVSTILDDDRLNVTLGGLSCITATRASNPNDPIARAADLGTGLPGPVINVTAMQIEKLYKVSP